MVERAALQPLEAKKLIGEDVYNDIQLLKKLVHNAVETNDQRSISIVLELYWLNERRDVLENEFNQLLKLPNHNRHQRMLRYLQKELKYPSSVSYIQHLLDSNYEEYFINTGSNEEMVCKWLSYALVGIGTNEAINLIKNYTNSSNTIVANEMKYRLKKIEKLSRARVEDIVVGQTKRVSWLRQLFNRNKE